MIQTADTRAVFLACHCVFSKALFRRIRRRKCPRLCFLLLGLSGFISVIFLSNLNCPFATKPKEKQQQKLVLFWTKFFRDNWEDHFVEFGRETLRGSDDPNYNWTCLFTTDRNRLDEADAVIFHGRDFNFEDLPQKRRSSQRWCFYLREANPYSGFYTDEKWQRACELGFNWTMTFSRRADVWQPYFRLIPKSRPSDKTKRFVESFSKRPKDAVWFVSHCKTASRRERLAAKMRDLGIGVDSFGRCNGTWPDPVIEKMGRDGFFSQYRFYLSFENSLCEDYITEKFGNALNMSLDNGVIPIAYGSNDYSLVAPNGSYINADDAFPSVEALVEYLKRLKSGANNELVQSYYDWHRNYQSIDTSYFKFGFENLCRKMFAEDHYCDKKETVITDLKSKMGKCRSPKFKT